MSRCGSLGTAQLAVAQADPAAAKRDPVELPLRFHVNCSGVPRGGKEAMQCLKDHVAVLWR